MAFGMKHWLSLVFALLVGVGVWCSIPPAPDYSGRPEQTPERQEWLELRESILQLSWDYQHIQRRDFLVEAFQGAVSGGDRLVVSLPEGTADSLAHSLSEAIDVHLAELGLQAPALPLGLSSSRRREDGIPPCCLSHRVEAGRPPPSTTWREVRRRLSA